MSRVYDAAIIGAGPAGSAAAYHASSLGLRVLLLDRTAFPRQKTCGDALSPRALRAISRMGLFALPGRRVRGMRMYGESGEETTREDFRRHGWPGAGKVLPRECLDHLLLERATAMGAEFQPAQVVEVLWRKDRASGVVVREPGGLRTIRADTVIAAAGSGTNARLLGARTRPEPKAWGIAGRAYLDVDADLDEDLEVYFPVRASGDLLYGYGWLFPTGDGRINAGVGIVRTPTGRPAIRALIESFLASRVAADARLRGALLDVEITTAPLAVGTRLEPRSGFLPVGDFAGLANPFTGEGIAAALESGEIAAQELVAAGRTAAWTYAERLRRHFARIFRSRSALPALYRLPALPLARARDVFRSDGTHVGEAVRRLVWDQLPDVPWWQTGGFEKVGSPIEEVKATVLHGIGRLRPLLAEVLACIIDDPQTRFGWYTAFAFALVPNGERLGPQPSTQTILVALETANLVARLHGDMRDDREGERVWGRNTLGLVIADCLTACTLRELYGLPRDWASAIGNALAHMLGDEAVRSTPGTRHQRQASPSLFLVAARAGLGLGPQDSVPDDVAFAATRLARLHDAAAAATPEGRPVAGYGDVPFLLRALEAAGRRVA